MSKTSKQAERAVLTDRIANSSEHNPKLGRTGKEKFNRRELRGLAIVASGGQIKRINDTLFLVRSQSGEGDYRVCWSSGRWSCACADFQKSKKSCKHIYAVNFALNLPKMIQANLDVFERSCPNCGSKEVIKKGKRYNKNGSVGVFLCKLCGTKFGDGANAKSRTITIPLAMLSIDLSCKGVSIRNISNHIWQVYGVRKSPSTIYGWISSFREALAKAAEMQKPRVGSRWCADEMVVNVRGKRMYLWNVLDHKTRYLLTSLLTERRGASEALAVLKDAIKRAGKAPKELVTDGLPSYSTALKSLELEGTRHVSRAGVAKAENNNRIERVHNTLRSIAKARRGIKSVSDLTSVSAYYNLIRPNIGLKNATPAQASALEISPLWRSVVKGAKET